jgi:hypothetical protein
MHVTYDAHSARSSQLKSGRRDGITQLHSRHHAYNVRSMDIHGASQTLAEHPQHTFLRQDGHFELVNNVRLFRTYPHSVNARSSTKNVVRTWRRGLFLPPVCLSERIRFGASHSVQDVVLLCAFVAGRRQEAPRCVCVCVVPRRRSGDVQGISAACGLYGLMRSNGVMGAWGVGLDVVKARAGLWSRDVKGFLGMMG